MRPLADLRVVAIEQYGAGPYGSVQLADLGAEVIKIEDPRTGGGGLVAALSLLAAVHAARRDGVGSDCDLSLFDTALSLLTYPATWHLTMGYRPARTRHSAHPSLVPFQAFPAADGWVVVGCAKEKLWRRLAVGRPELAGDPRFATFADRQRHAGDLLPLLEEIFAGRTVAEWLGRLRAARVPCGPVNDVPQALADPQVAARGMIVTTEHPRYGEVRQVASAVRVGEEPATYRRAPRPDQDLSYVVRELLGYTEGTEARLRAAGAFGDTAGR